VAQRIYNALFLCTGNSARSIMAEVLLRRLGAGRFQAFSAGSHPVGHVHPLAIELLQSVGYSTEDLRSKDWQEFAQSGAPPLDFVFTVCDKAAAEVCPVWPGQPMSAHWGLEDPAAVQGDLTQQRKAFSVAFSTLQRRISLLLSLPMAKLDGLALQRQLDDIGRAPPPT
jgi:arsenate reductase